MEESTLNYDQVALKSKDKMVHSFEIDGVSFKGSELRRVILMSESDSPFSVKLFLKSYIIHLLFFLGGSIVGNLLILLFFCNLKYLKNMEFLGTGKFFIIQNALSILVQVSIAYFVIFMIESAQNPSLNGDIWDMSHFFLMIIIRVFVISVKYGYYSEEHDRMI